MYDDIFHDHPQSFFAYRYRLFDITTSDHRLIPCLKRDLGGRHFAVEQDLQSMVTEFFPKQDAEWYSAGIHKLILRNNKCLDEQEIT